MDPSALIFVALAIAWAAYLIPKALEHHDAGARTRGISTFSERIRVLARREAISRRRSTLIVDSGVKPGDPAIRSTDSVVGYVESRRQIADSTVPPDSSPESTVVVEEVLAESVTDASTSRKPRRFRGVGGGRRTSAAVAARRRRRVLGLLVFVLAAVAAAAAGGAVSRMLLAAPIVLLVAWLVVCRLMVRRERAGQRAGRTPVSLVQQVPAALHSQPEVPAVSTGVGYESTAVVRVLDGRTGIPVPVEAQRTWEPVQAPLPTYVTKPAAPRRIITTIDLESTGVWTSGHTESDSALAREAETERAAREAAQPRRATGA